MSNTVGLGKRARSDWEPAELIQTPPVFVWPPQPREFAKWAFGLPGYLWPWNTLFAAIALLTWLFLTPDLERMKTFATDWIAFIFIRNLALIRCV